MNTEKHTGPLYIGNTRNGQGLIIDEETGANIAVTYDDAHAPYIVRACNSHAALLDALKRLERAAGGEVVYEDTMTHEEDIAQARAEARAIIADAEGGAS